MLQGLGSRLGLWAGLKVGQTDACRFQSSLSHCAWRNPERGLLGNGAFARFNRGVAETSVPVFQGSGFHLLNRSSEPYRSPHLCKEKYYSGRESKDHYNDETFGSPDNLSQDRSEEEKKRNSFELMRMATQEKQKVICDEHTKNLNPDTAIVLEDSGVDKKIAIKYRKSKGSEPCDAKEGHPENSLVCSSDLTHQLVEGGVLSCECLEEPILSEINGHYSTQHHLLNGRSSYDVEDSQSSCSYYDVASPHFLSLLEKGAGLTDLAESSKLNMWSLDKTNVSETEIDNNLLNKSGRVCINNFEKNLHGPISRTLIRDSESTALTGSRKDLTSRFKWDDTVESQILIGDNCIIPLTVNESGPIGGVEGIVFSSFLKQTGVSKRNSNLLVSNIQAKAGLDLQGGPESKLSSDSFEELDICLPDEDSLITVDDYIFPQDSLFVAAGGTSSAAVNTFGRLSDCGFAHLRAAATGFDHSGNHQLLQELPNPGYFPAQQLYGLPRVAFPQHTSDEMACYAQDQNAMLNSSLNFNQQFYNYLENASTSGNINPGKLYKHFEMGIESKADASSYYGWPCAGTVWETGRFIFCSIFSTPCSFRRYGLINISSRSSGQTRLHPEFLVRAKLKDEHSRHQPGKWYQ
ncbi:hypothetical protein CRYUN_Cryun07bG0107800 [Craigia yunnanensis]